MNDFIKHKFHRTFNVESLITFFYMEFSKEFSYDGESHDFWELVYIDKGDMLCTADKNKFYLKSGELIFHKPNEFHNLTADGTVAPNVSIISFECKSREMNFFEGKIFKLTSEEKAIFSMLFKEGLSLYKMSVENNPLVTEMVELDNAPTGSSQMIKNLLEVFLIKLRRNTDPISKKTRKSFGINDNHAVNEILAYIDENFYKRLTVADIAQALGKSESSVKKTFSTYKPNGIINYVNELRIKEAKRLIRDGKYNFSEIADMLNFDTPQYFSKCFKKIASMTPSEYKSSIL